MSTSSVGRPRTPLQYLLSLNSASWKTGVINPNRSQAGGLRELLLPDPFEGEHTIVTIQPRYAEPGGRQDSA